MTLHVNPVRKALEQLLLTLPLPSIDFTGCFNAKLFKPPDLSITSPMDAAWARPTIVVVPGSSRPLGIGLEAPNYREGEVHVEVNWPAHLGEESQPFKFWTSYIDPTIALFHRVTLLTEEPLVTVQFREAEEPESLGIVGQWSRTNLVFPYWVQDFPGT